MITDFLDPNKNIATKKSKRIECGSTNQDLSEDTLVTLTPVQDISRIIGYQTKYGRFMYGYAISNLNKELYDSISMYFYIFILSVKVI